MDKQGYLLAVPQAVGTKNKIKKKKRKEWPITSYLTNKKIKVFKDVAPGKYTFDMRAYKVIGTENAIAELKADVITAGGDENNLQYMTKKDNTKSEWFIQLQGKLKGDDLNTSYNINLYPDETKDIDMLMYQMSQIAQQLEIDGDEDIIAILEAAVHKTFNVWVYVNNVLVDGTLKQYKNTSFSEPKNWNADADFE